MICQLDDLLPRLDGDNWVADSARVIGRVHLLRGASVWFGAVLRGDNEPIVIGENSNVQEGAVLHTDIGVPLTVGRDVTIGHLAMLHGCTIGDNTVVGLKSTVLNRARIGANSIVGAGALVTEGKQFPDGVLLLGSPAKVVRELSPQEIAFNQLSARHYVQNAARYARGLKTIDSQNHPTPG
ncbi:MAG TPA: gamma carbonic anhydrase family protein [Nevskiaceae bacterium]|nr:gamma carbonic anhydrase family protein [Nevskiaceae bacterium]